MRLRLLVNASLAAAAAAADLVFLFLLLNPPLASRPGAVAALAAGPGLALAAALALPAAGAYLLYGWFARRALPRRWVQWRFWGGFFVVYRLAIVGAYALNARFYRHLLEPVALERLLQAGAILLASTLVVAGVVILRPLARRRPARGAALALLGGSWALLAWLAGAGGAPLEPRQRTELEALASDRSLRVLGVDGLSSDLLLPLASEGRLPAFARLMKEGAHGSLRSFPPGDEVTLWATVMTGTRPHRHGVRGPLRWRLAGSGEELALPPRGVAFGALGALGLVRSEPTGPGDLAARALWDLLSDFNVRAILVGFPLLDETERLPAVEVRRLRDPAGAPAAAVEEWLGRLVAPDSESDPDQDSTLRAGLGMDILALEEAARLQDPARPPQVMAVRLPGFDHVVHRFLRYHRPEEFGNVPARHLERYGESVAEYLKFLDAQVAREMDALHGRGLLLVVSPHGTRPVSLAGRLLQHLRGGPPLSGQHRSGPPGIFFLHGAGAQAGQKVDGARLADLLPTVLYLLGLPVARDLDGEPLTQALEPAFLEANPISSIPSYEGASIQERGPDALVEPEEFPPP